MIILVKLGAVCVLLTIHSFSFSVLDSLVGEEVKTDDESPSFHRSY